MPNRLLLPPYSEVKHFEGLGNYAIKRYYQFPFLMFYRKKLKMILSHLQDKKYDSILDFGCGRAEILRETLSQYSDDVDYVDTEHDLKDKKYDVITCSSVLEFMSLKFIVPRLNGLLKKDGMLIGASPMNTLLTEFYFHIIGDVSFRNTEVDIMNSLRKHMFVVRHEKWAELYFSFKAYKK